MKCARKKQKTRLYSYLFKNLNTTFYQLDSIYNVEYNFLAPDSVYNAECFLLAQACL